MIKRMLVRLISMISCCMLLLCVMSDGADAQIDPTIRVYLRRLQIEDALRIRIQGNYILDDGRTMLSDGAEITVVLRNGQLVLHMDKATIVLGESIKLLRCEGDIPGALYINDASGAYEGDLSLSISEDTIIPILSIHVEDYLLGVVPHEMGDSFPLEALKAQAVAARTYALERAGSDRAYDVEDTTNDQAYKGRTTYSPLSEQAVRETEGLCGTYQGKLAQCYYSASNGGQTELGQHVWPSENPDKYGYMDMRDDPYDYENDASSVKRFTLEKKPEEKGIGTALHSALVAALRDDLFALGITAGDDLVRFDEILSVKAITPKYESPSRLMTEIAFEVKLSVRDCLYMDIGSGEEQSMRLPVQEATPALTPTPAPTATPAYSPYREIEQVFTVVLPIFPDCEKAMGLSINVYQNELITVMDVGSSFVIESRRYGHGVGMSQRGAQQMAEKYAMTYEQILNFYYPGLEVKRYDGARAPLPTLNAELMATPAPTPSPTPRPTLMPVSAQNLPQGAYIASVTNIADDSSLNLREGPSLSAEIKRRLYKDQKLVVMSVSEDGWAHVKTDVIEGYVKTEYLQAIQEE